MAMDEPMDKINCDDINRNGETILSSVLDKPHCDAYPTHFDINFIKNLVVHLPGCDSNWGDSPIFKKSLFSQICGVEETNAKVNSQLVTNVRFNAVIENNAELVLGLKFNTGLETNDELVANESVYTELETNDELVANESVNTELETNDELVANESVNTELETNDELVANESVDTGLETNAELVTNAKINTEQKTDANINAEQKTDANINAGAKTKAIEKETDAKIKWKTDQLHKLGITGKGVTIAILDSGINTENEAFAGRIVTVRDLTQAGTDGDDDCVDDLDGHGTLVASVACGASFVTDGLNGDAITISAGVAPSAKIVVYKIRGKEKPHADVITRGLKQCLKDKDKFGIDILLYPNGSKLHNINHDQVIQELLSNNVLVVTASGNYGSSTDIACPARSGYSICVGACDEYGQITSNTCFGPALDLTAPGSGHIGAAPGHSRAYTTDSGSSFAAASVAGLLALMIQLIRDTAKLKSNADQLRRYQPSVDKLIHNQHVMKQLLKEIGEHKDHYHCLKSINLLLDENRLLDLVAKFNAEQETDAKVTKKSKTDAKDSTKLAKIKWITDQLHKLGVAGKGVRMAFLDAGIDTKYEAFTNRIVATRDLTQIGTDDDLDSDADDCVEDLDGHGTLVASVACGAAFVTVGPNGDTITIPAGVAPNAKIIVYKIRDKEKPHTDMITQGLKQCLEDKDKFGIDIVLLPYGSEFHNINHDRILQKLLSKNVLIFTASGTNGLLTDVAYPAKSGYSICVGACDEYGKITSKNCFGPALDFTVPGLGHIGATPGDSRAYTTDDGSLFAAASVAAAGGLGALILQLIRDTAKLKRNTDKLRQYQPSVDELVHNQHVMKQLLKEIGERKDHYHCLRSISMLLDGNKVLGLMLENVYMGKKLKKRRYQPR